MPRPAPLMAIHSAREHPATRFREIHARLQAREVRIPAGYCLGGVFLLGAVLRFGLLGQHSIWFDEAFVARIASQVPWSRVLPLLRGTDAHPPLFYLLMKAWVGIVGTTEVGLRIPSAVFSTLSIPLTYLLGRRILSPSAGLLAALFVAVSPLEIIAGQEARMYPLLQVLTLASTLTLIRCVEQGGAWRWTLYGVVSAAMAYTHYLGILVIAAHGLWLLGRGREHLASWFVTGAGILVVYLPWLPSLWYQTLQGRGWAWYRSPLSLQTLGDLGGLYAFGGSLFGMGDYFSDTTLAPLDQLILLSPFLAVFSFGIAALRKPDTRNKGLLESLLGVVIGVPFLISLSRPMFYPRWFSFLFPFYAVITAAGVLRLAELWSGRRDRIVALTTTGLLLYSLPVLAHYYLDPGARLYNWRGAATVVMKNARPGDFLLYTNEAAEIAFTYYFHGPNPSLVLNPIEAIPGPPHRPTFTPVQADRLASRYPRVWIIATPPFTPAMQDRIRRDLEGAFQPVGQRDFGDVWVTLVKARHTAGSSSVGSTE